MPTQQHPRIVRESSEPRAPDTSRSARLARLALVAAAAIPACHRGEAPARTMAPAVDAGAATPPVAPVRDATAVVEQLPAPPVRDESEQRVPEPPPGPIVEARPGPAELRVVPHDAGRRRSHPHAESHPMEARPHPEDISELGLKTTRK